MALYNANFTYIGENSKNKGFVVAAFDPDDGFKDTFLSMDPVYEESRHGEYRFDYGARYNSVSTIEITIIKRDLTDFSIDDVRSTLRWLTGSRTNSWLDIYCGNVFQYSFLGRVTDVKQRKLDGRIIGLMIIFTSISPWAFSKQFEFNRTIMQTLSAEENTYGLTLTKNSNEMSINKEGVLCNGPESNDSGTFDIDASGVISVRNIITANIDNQTDDLYTYINLDIRFENESCKWVEITNNTIGETTKVENLENGEIVDIINKHFIVSYGIDQVSGQLVNNNRIFGDDFNFVWPRLLPGVNDFIVNGNGNGRLKFSYRYPMKIGDCTIGEDNSISYVSNGVLFAIDDSVIATISNNILVTTSNYLDASINNGTLDVKTYSN